MENLDNNIKNLNLNDLNVNKLKIINLNNDDNFSKPKKYKNTSTSEFVSVKKEIKDMPLPFFF